MGNLIDGSGCGKGGRTVERLTYGKKYEFLRYSPQISQFPPPAGNQPGCKTEKSSCEVVQRAGEWNCFYRELVNGITVMDVR